MLRQDYRLCKNEGGEIKMCKSRLKKKLKSVVESGKDETVKRKL